MCLPFFCVRSLEYEMEIEFAHWERKIAFSSPKLIQSIFIRTICSFSVRISERLLVRLCCLECIVDYTRNRKQRHTHTVYTRYYVVKYINAGICFSRWCSLIWTLRAKAIQKYIYIRRHGNEHGHEHEHTAHGTQQGVITKSKMKMKMLSLRWSVFALCTFFGKPIYLCSSSTCSIRI